MPVLQNIYVSHQWPWEIKRRGANSSTLEYILKCASPHQPFVRDGLVSSTGVLWTTNGQSFQLLQLFYHNETKNFGILTPFRKLNVGL